jgi:hypothetical protein
MKINRELQRLLLKIHDQLGPDQRHEFMQRIRERLSSIEVEDVVGYTIAGAAFGAICEILPLDTITGIDDWVETGAALGASWGYFSSHRHKQSTREVERIIQEELRHANAPAH